MDRSTIDDKLRYYLRYALFVIAFSAALALAFQWTTHDRDSFWFEFAKAFAIVCVAQVVATIVQRWKEKRYRSNSFKTGRALDLTGNGYDAVPVNGSSLDSKIDQ